MDTGQPFPTRHSGFGINTFHGFYDVRTYGGGLPELRPRYGTHGYYPAPTPTYHDQGNTYYSSMAAQKEGIPLIRAGGDLRWKRKNNKKSVAKNNEVEKNNEFILPRIIKPRKRRKKGKRTFDEYHPADTGEEYSEKTAIENNNTKIIPPSDTNNINEIEHSSENINGNSSIARNSVSLYNEVSFTNDKFEGSVIYNPTYDIQRNQNLDNYPSKNYLTDATHIHLTDATSIHLTDVKSINLTENYNQESDNNFIAERQFFHNFVPRNNHLESNDNNYSLLTNLSPDKTGNNNHYLGRNNSFEYNNNYSVATPPNCHDNYAVDDQLIVHSNANNAYYPRSNDNRYFFDVTKIDDEKNNDDFGNSTIVCSNSNDRNNNNYPRDLSTINSSDRKSFVNGYSGYSSENYLSSAGDAARGRDVANVNDNDNNYHLAVNYQEPPNHCDYFLNLHSIDNDNYNYAPYLRNYQLRENSLKNKLPENDASGACADNSFEKSNDSASEDRALENFNTEKYSRESNPKIKPNFQLSSIVDAVLLESNEEDCPVNNSPNFSEGYCSWSDESSYSSSPSCSMSYQQSKDDIWSTTTATTMENDVNNDGWNRTVVNEEYVSQIERNGTTYYVTVPYFHEVPCTQRFDSDNGYFEIDDDESKYRGYATIDDSYDGHTKANDINYSKIDDNFSEISDNVNGTGNNYPEIDDNYYKNNDYYSKIDDDGIKRIDDSIKRSNSSCYFEISRFRDEENFFSRNQVERDISEMTNLGHFYDDQNENLRNICETPNFSNFDDDQNESSRNMSKMTKFGNFEDDQNESLSRTMGDLRLSGLNPKEEGVVWEEGTAREEGTVRDREYGSAKSESSGRSHALGALLHMRVCSSDASTMQISSTIITSASGHRDIEIKFYSSKS